MQNDETQWTEERIDLIKRTICPKGISTDEFLLFVEQCKRSGLDPLLKEAFCVPRRVNIGNKERPNWVTKHEFQPSEAGMLARAERMPDYRGVQASAVYAEDAIEIDQGKGEVTHRFNPAQRKGALVGAWSRVHRDGKVPTVIWLDFAAYSQSTPLWAKMPATMIEKCVRVAGLRKAYPAELGGLYIAGERPDDVDTGEDVETPAEVKREKPALPPPAPREMLETTAREAVTLSREGNFDKAAEVLNRAVVDAVVEGLGREPGSDDGEPDPMEREVAAILDAAEKASTKADIAALTPRVLAFPKGTPERETTAKAVNAANARILKGAA